MDPWDRPALRPFADTTELVAGAVGMFERISLWYAQQHLFLDPFYFIEYGIAQLAALEIWRESLRDWLGAVASYRRALALGGTKPLPRLFAVAGAQRSCGVEALRELVAFVEEQLKILDS